jgi:hypothetical protein
MKTKLKGLEQAYVIIKQYDSLYDYFQNYISFNKLELEELCNKFNKKLHKKFKRDDINPYKVMDLKSAIDEFRNNVADYYIEQDESY